MDSKSHKKIIEEFNEIPWELQTPKILKETPKILKTEFFSDKNQLLLKMEFSKTDSLMFSVCDFVSRKSVPFSDTPESIGSIELILNTQRLRNTLLFNTDASLEDVFTTLFGRLIAPAADPINHNNTHHKNKKGIISLTYDNTYFFLRLHKYALKTLTKVNLRNAGPHLTLRLVGLVFDGASFKTEYPNDRTKGNNVGRRYVERSVRRYRNGKSRTVYVKGGGQKVIGDSPIRLVRGGD